MRHTMKLTGVFCTIDPNIKPELQPYLQHLHFFLLIRAMVPYTFTPRLKQRQTLFVMHVYVHPGSQCRADLHHAFSSCHQSLPFLNQLCDPSQANTAIMIAIIMKKVIEMIQMMVLFRWRCSSMYESLSFVSACLCSSSTIYPREDYLRVFE
jgi:hypothetical protein